MHYPSAYLLAGEYVPEVALADEREHMEADLKEAHALLAAKGVNVIDHLVVGEPVDVMTKLVPSWASTWSSSAIRAANRSRCAGGAARSTRC